MTTTFKVVEFYRNNNSNNNNSSSNLNNSNNINHSATANANILNDKNENSLKKSSSNSNNVVGLTESPTQNSSATKTQTQLLNNNHIFSSLGFNVVGGYLTDIPATIVDIDFNVSNSKLLKVRKIKVSLSSLLF